jgi:hypothetical protein
MGITMDSRDGIGLQVAWRDRGGFVSIGVIPTAFLR